MEFFAGFEADGFARGDCDFCTCSRIAADACFTGFYGEDTEAPQLDAVACNEGLFHAVEDSVHRSLCFDAWQAGTLNNPLYKILLNHLGRRPWAVNFRKQILTGLSNVMLETSCAIVNGRTLP